MEEETSSHYALKIAVTILRERCQLFQRRITVLEEENLNLKSLCQRQDNNQHSLSQIDSLKQQVASANELNSQLQSRLKIISQENQQLWANLGKLTYVNKCLGSHLNKINDTLSQHVSHHQPLIRSKTFTQDKPQTEVIQDNLKTNEKNRLDLEDISLKLITSMSDAKSEMDSLVQDMTDVELLDNIITSSLGFSYEDENDDIIEDLKIILEELSHVKKESEKQNIFLKESLKRIKTIKDNSKWEYSIKKDLTEPIQNNENKIQTDDNIRTKQPDETPSDLEKMCPLCSQQFSKELAFEIFVNHVESHFKTEEGYS